LPSRRTAFRWLVAKEWRELMTSRAWWVMLALVGPLVGVTFADAVRSFAEVSAGAGAACGAVCAPLVGIWGPTFSAYELAAIFLLPFVAIRLVSGDRQSGALKLELQRPLSPFVRVGAKAAVLMTGWLIALAAAAVALALWASYGGTIAAPELVVVAIGHVLNAGLTIALAVALASMTEHPSTAAIGTLAVTIGTWVIDFAAAIHGGVWERIAAFTPAAMVSTFQHGLLRADLVLIAIALGVAGLGLGAVWMRLGVPVRTRIFDSIGVAAAATLVVTACTFVHVSWDASESRQNSFSEPAEGALGRLESPLTIDAHLAPQDPRRLQLERGPLAKLRRVLPDVRVTYTARTGSGLYEQADPGYGEVWYELDGRRASSRMVTDEGVLETIFGLAGVAPPDGNEAAYQGHPLEARPVGAALAFYGVWPVAVAGAGFMVMRRRT
jgi:ABC-2 type transport system permease protein